MLRAFLLRLARSSLGRQFTARAFAHVSFLIPVDRLRETDALLTFHHPRPGYPFHVLLVPKKVVGSLLDLTAQDEDFTRDLLRVVQELIVEFDLEAVGYRLICNGGPYQDVPHLHFHLVSNLGDGSEAGYDG